MIKNYYEILGLPFNAPENEIFKSYREKKCIILIFIDYMKDQQM